VDPSAPSRSTIYCAAGSLTAGFVIGASHIVTTIHPIKVVAVQSDGTIVVNYGDSVLTVGDQLGVFGLRTEGCSILEVGPPFFVLLTSIANSSGIGFTWFGGIRNGSDFV
jgi:hypothetical protein